MRRHRPRRCKRHYEKYVRRNKIARQRASSISSTIHNKSPSPSTQSWQWALSVSTVEAKQVVRNQLISRVRDATIASMESKLLTDTGLRMVQRTFASVPKIVFKSSYHLEDELDASVRALFDKMKRDNPRWTLRYLSDSDADRFLVQTFSPDVVVAFRRLQPGPYKADLLRYCLLYVHGGVWSDLTQSFHVPLGDLVSRHKEIILVKDRSMPPQVNGSLTPGTYQAFMASIPRHPILLRCIYFIVQANRCNYSGINSLDVTGPAMMHPYVQQYGYVYTMKFTGRSIVDIQTEQPLIHPYAPNHRQILSRDVPYHHTWATGEVWLSSTPEPSSSAKPNCTFAFYMWGMKPGDDNPCPKQCIQHNKNYVPGSRIIGPDDIEPLIVRYPNPKLATLWKLIPKWIIKADLGRLVYLYYHGGFYFDVDCTIHRSFLENVHPDAQTILFTERVVESTVGLEPRESKHASHKIRVSNFAMGSRCVENDFYEQCIEECILRLQSLLEKCTEISELDILWVCGPDVITTVYHRFNAQLKPTANTLVLLPETVATNGGLGSWRQ